MQSSYWLTRVRLESGFQLEEGQVMGTTTELAHIHIEQGVITEIVKGGELPETIEPMWDAEELLLLPSLTEKHVHLDKTLMGTRWQAVRPAAGVPGRCEVEKQVLASLPLSVEERAEKLLRTLLGYGSTHVRTHVDIYPEAGLSNLEGVEQVLLAHRNQLSYEIVAFPQHGLLRSGAAGLVKDAMRQGADLVGGVDPATVDGDMEHSLQAMVEIAVMFEAGIDLHLHDAGEVGAGTIQRLAELTLEAGLVGKVAVSHAFSLGDIEPARLKELSALLQEAGITIITSVPLRRAMPPVPELRQYGVDVAVGCDNIYDTWQPFGNGDVLERAGRLAERFGWSSEFKLSRALQYVTDGKLPLDDDGHPVWPKAGDRADMMLVQASCSAEAVARRSARKAVFYNGKLVAGQVHRSSQLSSL